MGVLINPVHFRGCRGARYGICSIGDHSVQLLYTYAACQCAESLRGINGRDFTVMPMRLMGPTLADRVGCRDVNKQMQEVAAHTKFLFVFKV